MSFGRSTQDPDCRILPLKRFAAYSFDYGKRKTWGNAEKYPGEDINEKYDDLSQDGHVHVHLPLHLPYAFGTMGPTHLSAVRDVTSCDVL